MWDVRICFISSNAILASFGSFLQFRGSPFSSFLFIGETIQALAEKLLNRIGKFKEGFNLGVVHQFSKPYSCLPYSKLSRSQVKWPAWHSPFSGKERAFFGLKSVLPVLVDQLPVWHEGLQASDYPSKWRFRTSRLTQIGNSPHDITTWMTGWTFKDALRSLKRIPTSMSKPWSDASPLLSPS